MAKVFTVAVHDPHSVSLYDAETGSYEGVIYVTSGTIIGTPIVSPKSISVTCSESGCTYLTIYDLPSKSFNKKIKI